MNLSIHHFKFLPDLKPPGGQGLSVPSQLQVEDRYENHSAESCFTVLRLCASLQVFGNIEEAAEHVLLLFAQKTHTLETASY